MLHMKLRTYSINLDLPIGLHMSSGIFIGRIKLPLMSSLVDFLASIITVAPALSFAHSSASALPGVLAFSGTEPVLRFVDVAVNHELSGMLVFIPVISIH